MIIRSSLPQVAEDFMNRDHEEAAAIINHLYASCEAGNQPAIGEWLCQLKSHCKEHFSREEDAMKRSGFPPFMIHKQEHERVLMDISIIEDAFCHTGDGHQVSRYLTQEFIPWLTGHINTMDKMTAEYLASHRAVSSVPGIRPESPAHS